VAIRIENNTVIGAHPFQLTLSEIPELPRVNAGKPIELTLSGNILCAYDVIFELGQTRSPRLSKSLSNTEARALLPHLVGWEGSKNLYDISGDGCFLSLKKEGEVISAERAIGSMADWSRYWASPEAESLQGQVRLRGGGVWARLTDHPSSLSLEDFRLLPDSPGHKAGDGARDLGANVDLVGPGAAYERWKLTPEYHEWKRSTERLIADGG
jgi:hypothetical protein